MFAQNVTSFSGVRIRGDIFTLRMTRTIMSGIFRKRVRATKRD